MKKESKYVIILVSCILLIGLYMPLISAGVLGDVINVGETIIDLLKKLFSFGNNGDSELDGELGNLGVFADGTGIFIIPSNINYEIGNEFELNVSVDDITDFYGFQFDLIYDPSILEFISINSGDFLGTDGNNVFFSYTNHTPGFFDNVYATRTGPVSGISGTGSIAKIRFKAIGEGSSDIQILRSKLIDSSVNEIVHVINNGLVNIGSILSCTDSDGDGFDAIDAINCPSGIDCDDGDPNRFPNNPEVCDGLDNDCNVLTDDGIDEGWYNEVTNCGVGVCKSLGNSLCINSLKEDSCIAGTPTGDDNDCDGKDNNCDGMVDEGCNYCVISNPRFSESIIKNNTEIEILVDGNGKCSGDEIQFEIYDKNDRLLSNITGNVGNLSVRYIPKSDISNELFEIYTVIYPKENSSLSVTSQNLIVKPDRSRCYEGSLSSLKDTILINNNKNLSLMYNETKVLARYERLNKTIFSLLMDCTLNKIDIDRLNVSLQENNNTKGYTIVNNLNISGKIVYVDKINNSNRLCIMDTYNVTNNECNSTNGIIINCPGNQDQYTCSIIENRYVVTNLSHSSIFELESVCGDSVCNGNEACGSCASDCGVCSSPGSNSPSGGSSGGSITPPIITIKSNETNTSTNISDRLQVEANQSDFSIVDLNNTDVEEPQLKKNIFDKLNDHVIHIGIVVFIVVFLVILVYIILKYNKWKRKNNIKDTKIKLKDNFK